MQFARFHNACLVYGSIQSGPMWRCQFIPPELSSAPVSVQLNDGLAMIYLLFSYNDKQKSIIIRPDVWPRFFPNQ